MFSKGESKNLREEFWTSFGQVYPRKWLLYNTRIKDLQLKFTFNNKIARVSLDLTSKDEIVRAYYYEKLESLKDILQSQYLPDVVLEENHQLPEGKIISTAFVEIKKVNIYNQKDWPLVMNFFEDRMHLLELFFLEFRDFIES